MSTPAPAASASGTTSSPTLDAAAIALLAQLPADTEIPLLDAARQASATATLPEVFEATPGVSRSARPTGGPGRFAGLVVGAVGEQDFEQRYQQLLPSQEFTLADQTKEGTDTDFLTEDTAGRPALRINVKMYGTRFEKAQTFVGLDPEDTFGIATYKVRQAVRKSQREALPFLFAIASAADLRADAVAAGLPAEVRYILDTKALYKGLTGWKAVEDLMLGHLLDPAGHGSSPLIVGLRAAVAAVDYRVISAIKANHLMNEKLDERVPAVSNPQFKVAPNSQPNMHFSLSEDMIGLDELLDMLAAHGIQHVATKIAYREI